MGPELLVNLEKMAVYTGLVDAVLGGVITHTQIFIVDEKSLFGRIDLLKNSLMENVSKNYQRMFSASLVEPNANLRGMHSSSPDLIGDHVKELFRVFNVFVELDKIKNIFRASYTALFLIILGALASSGVAFFWENGRVYVSTVCFLFLIIQISLVIRIRITEGRLGIYERTV